MNYLEEKRKKEKPISKEGLATLRFIMSYVEMKNRRGEKLSRRVQKVIRNFISSPWWIIDGRKSREYRVWRKAVLRRDKKRCRRCGKKKNLEVHHKRSFATKEFLRYTMSNGITLCERCHKMIHKAKKSSARKR